MKNKDKILDIIILLSMLPYIAILICSMCAGIFGTDFLNYKEYGLNYSQGISGMLDGIYIMCVLLVRRIPVIPFCLVLQLAGIAKFLKKHYGTSVFVAILIMAGFLAIMIIPTLFIQVTE